MENSIDIHLTIEFENDVTETQKKEISQRILDGLTHQVNTEGIAPDENLTHSIKLSCGPNTLFVNLNKKL